MPFFLRRVLKLRMFLLETAWQRTGGLLFLAALLGIASGLVAVAFHAALHAAQKPVLGGLLGLAAYGGNGVARLPRYLFFLVPALGGLLSGLLTCYVAPGAAGAGTDGLIDAFHNRGGRVPIRVTAMKFFTSLFTLASGGSAGQEGPIAQIGGGLGSLLGRVTGLSTRQRRLLLLTGTAGGLGAIFRAPLGGALTAAEIVYKEDFESGGFLAFVVASVTGYSTFEVVTRETGAYLSFPVFPFTHLGELLAYVLVGLACVPFSWAFVHLYRGLRAYTERQTFLPRWAPPALGGLLVGLVAYAFPQVLSTGWGHLLEAVNGRYAFTALLLIAAAKIVATSLTIGSGGSGGVFGPSLFIGGMVGGAVGFGLSSLFPGWVTSPGSYVLVGMGAFFAGAAKAPLAGLVMVCEITGNYGLLPPLLLAGTAHLVLSRGWTLYDSQRHDKFQSPAHAESLRVNLLREIPLEKAFSESRVTTLSADDPVERVAERIAEDEAEIFPVTDGAGRVTGLVARDTLRDALRERAAGPLLVAGDLMTPPRVLARDLDLGRALSVFLESGASQLPVVDAAGRPVGLLRLHDVAREYERLTAPRR